MKGLAFVRRGGGLMKRGKAIEGPWYGIILFLSNLLTKTCLVCSESLAFFFIADIHIANAIFTNQLVVHIGWLHRTRTTSRCIMEQTL
jgi:hypothetical protein